MAFRFVCHGRGPLQFLQHLRNGHASLFKPASSNLFLSKSFTNKPLTVREWVTRSASEESAPVEPVEADIPGIQEAVAVENAFAQLGVDDRLLVRPHSPHTSFSDLFRYSIVVNHPFCRADWREPASPPQRTFRLPPFLKSSPPPTWPCNATLAVERH